MLPRHVLIALLSALTVQGLPLNINLGAYSPALVVGDGEISFGGGAERASQVLQTLATGAQNGATANGQRAPEVVASPPPAAAAPAPAAPAPAAPGAGVNSPLVPPPAGQQAPPAAQEAAVILPDTNAAAATPVQSSLSPPEFISHKIDNGFDPSRKYPNLIKRDDALTDIIKRGNQIASNEVAKKKIKRDIDGFREALAFARDALRNGPRVELGTENAGIGILVNAGSAVPVNSPANGAQPPRIARRDLAESSEETKLGMTLIAISEI